MVFCTHVQMWRGFWLHRSALTLTSYTWEHMAKRSHQIIIKYFQLTPHLPIKDLNRRLPTQAEPWWPFTCSEVHEYTFILFFFTIFNICICILVSRGKCKIWNIYAMQVLRLQGLTSKQIIDFTLTPSFPSHAPYKAACGKTCQSISSEI